MPTTPEHPTIGGRVFDDRTAARPSSRFLGREPGVTKIR
jgi:hypothetical protein